METESQRESPHTPGALVGGCSGGPERRSESDRPGAACGLGRSEAAYGDHRRGSTPTGFAGVCGTGSADDTVACGVHDRTGRATGQAANPGKKRFGLRCGNAESGFAGVGVLIQISPQLRILVAIEAIDGRKGIDSLAQLCREKIAVDPFSGCLFIFRSRSGKAIRILTYDGQGFWIATKRLSKGRFKWWPTGSEPAKTPRAHQAQLLLAAGNPDAEAAPVWRRVSA
jgi:transposase